ncbi:hypothetical protein F2Q68_00026717 [Brassica cretica]|uniref:CCHC-type domain-containing protein n=1 Tax=Brassica cretica TaxID=69181 RepID=A0A8S9I9M8_BRACR|nr:hypothetical protein F2Q68_00026717 [Brassica cretica]
MMARNYGKMVNDSSGKNQYGRQRGDRGRSRRREGLECFECEGVCHIRDDCPVAQQRKLKFLECRGVGHIRRECSNSKKEKGVSLQSSDDLESDDKRKVMKNVVAFGARKEGSSESLDSDVDTDDEEYHVLLNKWLKLKEENLRLQHDLVQSHEQNEKQSELVEELVQELVGLKKKNESLEHEVYKEYHVLLNKWLKLKEENLRLQHDLVQSHEQNEKQSELVEELVQELVGLKKKNESLEHEVYKVEPKKFVAKYVGTYDNEYDKKFYSAASATASGQTRCNIRYAVVYVGRLNIRRSDLEVDQEASSSEPEHRIVCSTKGKKIEVRQEVMRGDHQEGDSEVIPKQ